MTRYIVHDRRNSTRDILGMLFAGEIPPNRIYLTRASAERDKFPTEDVFPVSAYAGVKSRLAPETAPASAEQNSAGKPTANCSKPKRMEQ